MLYLSFTAYMKNHMIILDILNLLLKCFAKYNDLRDLFLQVYKVMLEIVLGMVVKITRTFNNYC